MHPAVSTGLRRQATAHNARLVLIRRHESGHAAHKPAPRRYAWATCTPGATATRWHLTETDDDLSALADPRDASSIEGPATIYLTCTQGRHDVCCALWGRPIARQLAALRPEASFECSHMGGDRFAANVVVLPWGLVYGQVELGDVDLVVEETEADRMVPRLLRGRSWYAAPIQAALIHLAQTSLDRRIDAWTPVAARALRRRLGGAPRVPRRTNPRRGGGRAAPDGRVPADLCRALAVAAADVRGAGFAQPVTEVTPVAGAGPDRFGDDAGLLLTSASQLAPLAQLAEQRTLNPRVRGSSPWRRTPSDLGRCHLLGRVRRLGGSVVSRG